MIALSAFGWKLAVCYLNVPQRLQGILTSMLGQTRNGYYLRYSCLPETTEILVSQSTLVEGSVAGAASFQEP